MTPNQISSRQNPNHFENAIFDQKPAAADNLFSLQSWLPWTKGKDRFPPYCLHLSDSLKSLDMREEERGGGPSEQCAVLTNTLWWEHRRCGIRSRWGWDYNAAVCGWAFMQLWLQSLSSRLQAEATQPESPPVGASCQIMDAIKC